ncbi:MAG: glycosyltransferase [Dysgonomonas sp.]|nr:glycosyltransferase [Dysgonomonas sp.]
MRVLQVITNLGTGGAERLLADSVPIYINRGINMDILLLNGEKYPFYNQLREHKVRIYSLGLGSVYNPFLIFKIIPYLRKYDIIHVHLFPTLYWVSIAKILSFSKVKLIFTEHNTLNRRMGSSFWKIIDRVIYKTYSRVVSITDEVQLAIKNHLGRNIVDLNFSVITNGIDLSKFISTTLVDKTEKKVIIQVSSFRDQKDQPTLIKAMSLLPEDLELLLVGEGENKRKCEKLAKELDLTTRVHFLGIRTDIAELFRSSDIAILSSHYEGFGLSAVEAMASGKPLIASDVPGLSRVVEGAGLLFSPGNDKDLANKINSLIKDEELYIKTAEACQKRAEEYDINIMVNKYIMLYKELMI